MNERMIELYKEACEFAYKVCKDDGRTGGPSDHIWNTLSTGKFAELIVRECIEQLNISNVPGPISAGLNLGRVAIKEHFGVDQ